LVSGLSGLNYFIDKQYVGAKFDFALIEITKSFSYEI